MLPIVLVLRQTAPHNLVAIRQLYKLLYQSSDSSSSAIMVACLHFIVCRCISTSQGTVRKIFATVAVFTLCLCLATYYGWLLNIRPPVQAHLIVSRASPFKRLARETTNLTGGIIWREERLNAVNCSSLQGLARLPVSTGEDPKPLTELQPAIEKNCSLLRAGDEEEVRRVKLLLKKWNDSEAQEYLRIWINGDCSNIAQVFRNNFYVSQEELDFPIAFVMLVYTNPVQVVRLLRTIYRPHNLYCIHPDAKQSTYFISVFRKLAECLDNVIVASELHEVYWGYHTIMDGELTCMQDLLHFEGHQWNYIVNIGGQELPLKTNREIVAALKGLEGTSAVSGEPIPQDMYNDRFVKVAKLSSKQVILTKWNLPPVPHGIKLYKGTRFFSITRNFTKFILTNQKAVDLREYMKEVFIPEEEFYVSLYMLPEAPVKRLSYEEMPVVDLAIWDHDSKHCTGGIFVRQVCIVGVSELHNIHVLWVGAKPQVFFMNKYHSEKDHVVMDCMEEWLLRQNAVEYTHDMCS